MTSACPRCTQALATGAMFCPRCGIDVVVVREPTPVPPPRPPRVRPSPPPPPPPPPRPSRSVFSPERPPEKKRGSIWVFILIGFAVTQVFRVANRPTKSPPPAEITQERIRRDLEQVTRHAREMRGTTGQPYNSRDLERVERDAPVAAVPASARRVAYVCDVPRMTPGLRAVLQKSIHALDPDQRFFLAVRGDDTLVHLHPTQLIPATTVNKNSAAAILDTIDEAAPGDVNRSMNRVLQLRPDLLILITDPAAAPGPSALEPLLTVFTIKARIDVVLTSDADTPYARSLRNVAGSTGGSVTTLRQ